MASGLHESPKASLIDTESDSDTDFLGGKENELQNSTRNTPPRHPIDVKVEVSNPNEEEFHCTGDLGIHPPIEINQSSQPSTSREAIDEDAPRFTELHKSESEDDVTRPLHYKRRSLLWLRHPKVRENWKTVAASFALLIAGVAFLITGIAIAASPEHDGPKTIIFFVCSAICLLPGGYHTVYIYCATKGARGYNFESIPSFR